MDDGRHPVTLLYVGASGDCGTHGVASFEDVLKAVNLMLDVGHGRCLCGELGQVADERAGFCYHFTVDAVNDLFAVAGGGHQFVLAEPLEVLGADGLLKLPFALAHDGCGVDVGDAGAFGLGEQQVQYFAAQRM